MTLSVGFTSQLVSCFGRRSIEGQKAQAKATYNNVLMEGNIDNWFRYFSNRLFYFIGLTVEIRMDKYIRNIITASCRTSRQGYTGWKNWKTRDTMVAII